MSYRAFASSIGLSGSGWEEIVRVDDRSHQKKKKKAFTSTVYVHSKGACPRNTPVDQTRWFQAPVMIKKPELKFKRLWESSLKFKTIKVWRWSLSCFWKPKKVQYISTVNFVWVLKLDFSGMRLVETKTRPMFTRLNCIGLWSERVKVWYIRLWLSLRVRILMEGYCI